MGFMDEDTAQSTTKPQISIPAEIPPSEPSPEQQPAQGNSKLEQKSPTQQPSSDQAPTISQPRIQAVPPQAPFRQSPPAPKAVPLRPTLSTPVPQQANKTSVKFHKSSTREETTPATAAETPAPAAQATQPPAPPTPTVTSPPPSPQAIHPAASPSTQATSSEASPTAQPPVVPAEPISPPSPPPASPMFSEPPLAQTPAQPQQEPTPATLTPWQDNESTPALPISEGEFDASGIADEEFFDEPTSPSVVPTSTQTAAATQVEPVAHQDPSSNAASRKYALIGQVLFDSYAVLDLIGEGSTCYVYSAMQVDSANEAIVAVKTPKVVTPGIKDRFSQAVIKHGKLKHPHIVRSLKYLESPEQVPFFILENQQGVTLEEILQSVDRLDDEDAIALILIQLAAAVEFAHSLGITHDWLTPHNILLADENEQLQVKVSDFQLAGLTDFTSGIKDICYLSPEAVRGQPPTPQSDVYSLGAIAFRMVTGQLPFGGKSRGEETTPDPLAKYGPDLKRVHQLNQIVQEALEFELSWRLDTAVAFKEAIQEWIDAVHAELATEPDYATGVSELPSFDPPAQEGFAPQPLPQAQGQPYAPEPAPLIIRPSEPELTSTPPTVPPTLPESPSSEPVLPTAEVSQQQSRRARRALNRTGKQQLRQAIHELSALKQKQFEKEQSVAMKFTEKIASETEGPRRSPLATMARLIATIVICGGVTIGCVVYILMNPQQVRESYLQASRQLSMLLPGKVAQPEEVAEGPKIVPEKPKKADKERPALKPHEIRANTQDWAVPREPGQAPLSTNSPSFGVTNNWVGPKRKGNRVRIEYRDYENRGN